MEPDPSEDLNGGKTDVGSVSIIDKERYTAVKAIFEKNAVTYAAAPPVYSSEILQLYDLSSMKLKDPSAADDTSFENLILVDCRDKEEQEVSMIPNAVTASDFESQYCNAEALADAPNKLKSTLVAPYCTVGRRSGMFATKLVEKGVPHVRNMDGILMWLHAGGTVVTNEDGETAITKEVHTFSKNLNYAPESYKQVAYGLMSKIKKTVGLKS